ncbi:MAG: hypothetical protein PUG69_01970 [Ruminococcus sp.]|nr:hypothetical protein [Ruminococcus sp.]
MKKRKIIAGVSVLLAVALLLCVILSVAKYIIKKGQQSELTSQNFYFSSNFLKSDEVPTYNIYGNTVTFAVRNYIDSFRVNATDINYTVSADSGALDILNGSLEGAASSSANITLSYDFATDELQKEITVSVTGTGKFTKTLSAKFIFIKYDGLKYEIKDQADRDYAELYIYTGNTASDVTIAWNKAELLIDETNDYIFGNTTLNAEINSVTIRDIPADTTVKIVFFKKNIAQDYTCGITKSDGSININ